LREDYKEVHEKFTRGLLNKSLMQFLRPTNPSRPYQTAILKLFEDGRILAAATASRFHIGCADMSLRRNPAS
jgi:hypothetical protein